MEIAFWVSVCLIFYTYIGYAVFIYFLSRFYPEPSSGEPEELPELSVIISAYNEEKIIREKIQNCLEFDYPPERLEILVGSDGSTDGTNEILEKMDDPRLRVFCYADRHGKSRVINRLVQESRGGVLVFTDADIVVQKDALRNLVKPFQRTDVGGVCGNLIMVLQEEDSSTSVEQTYWSFERRLRKLEGRIKTMFGATGAIYAIRRSLFRELPVQTPVVDDFMIPLQVTMQGFRVVYAEDAVATAVIVDDILLEFKRRIRIGARSFSGIRYYAACLHPKHGFVSFGLWSHKMLRWSVPFLLVLLFIATLMLSHKPFYAGLLYAEYAFLACAAAGIVLNILNIKIKPLSYCAYILMLNCALLLGFFKFLFKMQKPYWEITNRLL